jgi:putative N6-adenine-specific DNA methylase
VVAVEVGFSPRYTRPVDRIFCACSPGLEPFLADELRALGLEARAVAGGAEAGGEDAVALACIGSRLADAVKLRTRRGSLDAAGEPLFRRGFRPRVGAAPLRETLAAGLLAVAGWDGSRPLLDPMCGSGTIPIEAALLAARRAPGLHRRFEFESWPGHDARRTAAVRARLAAGQRAPPAPIHASDRNAGALRLARRNAADAGVETAVRFERADAAAAPVPPAPGALVVNPPYGARLDDALPAWAALRALLDRLPGWRAVVLAPSRRLEDRLGREPESELEVRNGGLRCRVLRFRL